MPNKREGDTEAAAPDPNSEEAKGEKQGDVAGGSSATRTEEAVGVASETEDVVVETANVEPNNNAMEPESECAMKQAEGKDEKRIQSESGARASSRPTFQAAEGEGADGVSTIGPIESNAAASVSVLEGGRRATVWAPVPRTKTLTDTVTLYITSLRAIRKTAAAVKKSLRLLDASGVFYQVVDIYIDEGGRDEFKARAGTLSVPRLFCGSEDIGGIEDIIKMADADTLAETLLSKGGRLRLQE